MIFDEDLEEHQPFPTLQQVLEALDPHVGFNIEIKWTMQLKVSFIMCVVQLTWPFSFIIYIFEKFHNTVRILSCFRMGPMNFIILLISTCIWTQFLPQSCSMVAPEK